MSAVLPLPAAPRGGRTFAAEREPWRSSVALEAALDRIAEGFLIIDAQRRLHHANRAARELLMQLRGELGLSGTLAFAHPDTQHALLAALHECGAIPLDRAENHAGSVSSLRADPYFELDEVEPAPRQFLVRDADGAIVARAALEPLPLRGALSRETCTALFLLRLHAQPEAAQVPSGSLSALYGLTPGEARVASAVVAAGSVAALAARLRLSPNTVKSHLKRVFAKCGVQSLAALAALVATGPRLR